MTSPASVRIEYGEVFTKRWVVDLILDLCDYKPDRDLTQLRLVEPSVGSGAFLGPILDRLLSAKDKHAGDVPWLALRDSIRCWDLQPDHVKTAQALAAGKLVDAGCPENDAHDLARSWIHVGDFLLTRHERSADLVVGNPPYIRIEDLPEELLAAYRANCPTMGGRADVFIGFYEHGLDSLMPDGRLAFICADRWMRNAYGKKLRGKIADGPFSVDTVLTMHDAEAFETEVSAYPAVTVLRRGKQGPVATGLTTDTFRPEDAERFSTWAEASQVGDSLRLQSVTAARLPHWHEGDSSWPEGSPATLAWLEKLEDTLPVLEDKDTGTKISIGIATGADAVYIRHKDELPKVEDDRLIPLAMTADVTTGEFRWGGKFLVSPWRPDGLVELAFYKQLSAYFKSHEGQLRGRNVAKRSDRWWRTIDRLNFDLLERPMLVLADLRARMQPVLVPKEYYPHHNLYYVISDRWDLEALGGLLLSEVIERQVAAYCVKMRGGTLRFQAQYLRRVRCPHPDDIDVDVLSDLASAFRNGDRKAATTAALRAYDLDSLPE